jgi:hypothetical protein
LISINFGRENAQICREICTEDFSQPWDFFGKKTEVSKIPDDESWMIFFWKIHAHTQIIYI